MSPLLIYVFAVIAYGTFMFIAWVLDYINDNY